MKRSFWSLIAVQVQVLINDNAAKLMLMTLGVIVAPELFPQSAETNAKMIKTVLAAIIILPFVLFSPVAGWIADRFSKRVRLVDGCAVELPRAGPHRQADNRYSQFHDDHGNISIGCYRRRGRRRTGSKRRLLLDGHGVLTLPAAFRFGVNRSAR